VKKEKRPVKVKNVGHSSDIQRILAGQWRRLRRWPPGTGTTRD